VARIVLLYLLAVNLLTYIVFWWDKRRATKGERRVSERELLLWTFAGGSIGAGLAMRKFRHKSRKLRFRISYWTIVALQVALVWWLIWRE